MRGYDERSLGWGAETLALLVTEGPRAGERVAVESQLVLGRGDVDLALEDLDVSHRHALLRAVDGALEIEDLESRNGTYVNGMRIRTPTVLSAGDVVRVGTTVLEVVGERAGVSYVNDSKATNVAAARRALESYAEQGIRVILGGSVKGESFEKLAAAMGPNVRCAYLIGQAAVALAEALERAGVPYEHAGDLEAAVRGAAGAARPGEVVLLSPACASFDQFRDFEERGERFRQLVEAL